MVIQVCSVEEAMKVNVIHYIYYSHSRFSCYIVWMVLGYRNWKVNKEKFWSEGDQAVKEWYPIQGVSAMAHLMKRIKWNILSYSSYKIGVSNTWIQ